jgi:hypothetical protein
VKVGLSEANFTKGEVEAQIVQIRFVGKNELRSLWRSTMKADAPSALTKDLLARILIWHLQEEIWGGLSKATLKFLENHAAGQAQPKGIRRFKSGTVLVREYQGQRHSVTVTPDGFVWNETTYKSLSVIAREITGSRWNGPRFFGLRGGDT